MKALFVLLALVSAPSAFAEVGEECGTINKVTQMLVVRFTLKNASGIERDFALWHAIQDKSTVMAALANELRVCVTYIPSTNAGETATAMRLVFTR